MNRTSASLLIAALAVTAVACDDDGRGYAVPEKVCDTKVDPDLLAPLLPDGEEIHQRDVPREHGATCDVSVQGGDGGGVYIKRDAVPEGDDPLKVREDTLIRYGNPKRVDIGDDARLADQGALITTSCAPKGKDTTFALEVHLSSPTPEDVSERRKALERFLRSYLPTAAKAHGCA
ncbi:hypothetical protein [Streptomyces cucumeris]|uniref:hypothetical protein n=1 Tax=Streptomyces cucumeris TaxID=2962890 RepID=UPI003D72DC05